MALSRALVQGREYVTVGADLSQARGSGRHRHHWLIIADQRVQFCVHLGNFVGIDFYFFPELVFALLHLTDCELLDFREVNIEVFCTVVRLNKNRTASTWGHPTLQLKIILFEIGKWLFFQPLMHRNRASARA